MDSKLGVLGKELKETKMKYHQIIEKLPYEAPFLFVDEVLEVSEEHCKGSYTLKEDEFFYKGHFKDKPITPGVILTEIMAQIGLVCLGIFLLQDHTKEDDIGVAMSSMHMEFYKSVLPGEKVTVVSEKEYFRFNKLKCNVKMFNESKVLVAKGVISGMIVSL